MGLCPLFLMSDDEDGVHVYELINTPINFIVHKVSSKASNEKLTFPL